MSVLSDAPPALGRVVSSATRGGILRILCELLRNLDAHPRATLTVYDGAL